MEYKICRTEDSPLMVEDMYRAYNHILHNIDNHVTEISPFSKKRVCPSYKGEVILYDDKSFCIYRVITIDNGYIGLHISEFYAPNCGKELLSKLVSLYSMCKCLTFDLEILNKNEKAKKFWFKQLGEPITTYPEKDWITGYTFEVEKERFENEQKG